MNHKPGSWNIVGGLRDIVLKLAKDIGLWVCRQSWKEGKLLTAETWFPIQKGHKHFDDNFNEYLEVEFGSWEWAISMGISLGRPYIFLRFPCTHHYFDGLKISSLIQMWVVMRENDYESSTRKFSKRKDVTSKKINNKS